MTQDFVHDTTKFLAGETPTMRDTGDDMYLYRFKGYKNCIRKMKIRNVYCGVIGKENCHTYTHILTDEEGQFNYP